MLTRSTFGLRRLVVLVGLVGLVTLSAAFGPALAAGDPDPLPGEEKFFIAAGGFLISLDNDARVDGAGGALGTTISLENLLGLEPDRNLARVEGFWRFKPRHRLDVAYYFMNRTGSRVIDQDIDFQDIHIEANAQVSSDFTQQYLKASYRFAFLNDPRMEFGLSAGLATFGIDAAIEGDAQVIVGGVPSGPVAFRREEKSVVAPVPNIGLYGEFRLTKRLVLRQSFDYFSLQMDDWRGRYSEFRAGIDWRFTSHFGFGFGWDRTVLLYKESGDRALEVNADFSGLVWYFSYSH